ncbi:MAG: hypothetical protein KatS3mg051_1435 [Anaerolineae bacterium]|nr:MAG: hypothetical protein KatS3mg051_1435 [Anaerolineae bacterium]
MRPDRCNYEYPVNYRRGEDHPAAKLNEAQVREIKALLARGAGYRFLARRYRGDAADHRGDCPRAALAACDRPVAAVTGARDVRATGWAVRNMREGEREMLEVSFGTQWERPQRLGLAGWHTEDGLYLVVRLSLRAVNSTRKRVSIGRARWRLNGIEYQTTRVSVSPRDGVLLVWARRVA